ncbi:MAG: gamma-glutamyl-gamma-aminobutyrate hydrolase family protein [Bacillota bacterium]|nr:gamma-glutamyl-gamma-aminobutyrate hydrolase family protein [Bacillota bacterium]
MSTKPLIGIASGFDPDRGMIELRPEYAFGVAEAGGIPVLLPVPGPEVPDDRWLPVLDRLDGLLLSGGPDLAPAEFGEPPLKGLGRVVPERDHYELVLTRRALELDLPVLGICRGIQTLAVAAGGTLYQDIDSQVAGVWQHRQLAPRWHASHAVRLLTGSVVAEAYGRTEIMVNTFHHQAVKGLPEGFVATAWSDDGLIEAMESTRHKLAFGVQWHPEGLWAHDRLHLAVFTRLVSVAGAGQGRS